MMEKCRKNKGLREHKNKGCIEKFNSGVGMKP